MRQSKYANVGTGSLRRPMATNQTLQKQKRRYRRAGEDRREDEGSLKKLSVHSRFILTVTS